ncbi:heparinase II/III domain-containing protein [Tannockella kyphosi]|uniref:heparinase II/III domain-containing protein n=1 Tax=Tannockella kyphosi TaxID=2899121 RepID=UPI0020135DEB|nr:heparinase II/III family protein [Tannockella kyphosi]
MKIFDINEQILTTNPKYMEMLESMKKEAEKFCNEFHDSPEYLSEWGHNYFCPEDGERLIFDLDKPHEHVCQLCHTVYQNKTFDNVWRYFYRNTAILTLMKLATLYRVEKDSKYLTEYKKILGFYSDHYVEFALHAKDKIVDESGLTVDVGGAARLMPQGLNEAIVAIRIIISLELLKGELEEEFLEGLNKNLFIPITDILIPQITHIHNIPCWLNAAVGVIGLYTQNQSFIDLVFKGEFGINEQLKQGVTGDKFWYEGSIHYNFFLLEGVVDLMAFAQLHGQEFASKGLVEEMLIRAYHYAFDNDILPNPNDGWPNVTLKSYEYIYCLATKVFGEDSEVGNIYKNICANPSERVEFPLSKPFYYNNEISFERMSCLPDLDINNRSEIKRTSTCFENSYFGMLKNDHINVFMKYGHRGPSHAHPDKMNIEVMVEGLSLSRDLSNTGYGSKLCNEWHRHSLSHNTVLVDGKNHVSTEGGKIVEFNDTICHSLVEDVYEGVDYQRRVEISDHGFTDSFGVESKEEHQLDWIFHSEATLLTEVASTPAKIEYDAFGYEHLKDVRKVVSSDELRLQWKLGKVTLTSIIDTKDKDVFMAQTYDNPVSRFRTAIILRTKNKTATFNAVWEIEK